MPSPQTKDRGFVPQRGKDSGLHGSSEDSPTAISECSSQSRGRSAYDTGDDGRRQRRRRRKLRVVRQLSESFACAADYRKHKLVSNTSDWQGLFRPGSRFRKKIDIQMRPHDLRGTYPAVGFSFLARSHNACSLSHAQESIAVE